MLVNMFPVLGEITAENIHAGIEVFLCHLFIIEYGSLLYRMNLSSIENEFHKQKSCLQWRVSLFHCDKH